MPKLAIHGGPAAAQGFTTPQWPVVTTEDKIAVLEALEGRNWCLGPKLHEFMPAMAKYHDAKYCIATSNGTTALQLALRAAGVQAGDEVIAPAVTFVATVSAIAEIGAIPIFGDIEPETAQLSVASVESLITPRTTAVLGVHYGGYPFDLDAMRELCKRRGLLLIEDCAHAQGTEWRGRKVGALGDASGMSLQASKALAVGEGGLVFTDSQEIYERGWLIHNIGRGSIQAGLGHHVLSSNYRLHEIQAALGLSALKRHPRETALRHRNGEWLAEQLAPLGGVEPLRRDPRITQRGYYFFILRYDAEKMEGVPRDRFMTALHAEGVPCGSGYGIPQYKNAAFEPDRLKPVLPHVKKLPAYHKLSLPVSERFCGEQQITLSHPVLMAARSDLKKLVAAFAKVKGNLAELSEK
ncbi:MAG: aminotransferase DegT [Armatimonadetes bacterium CG_4_10_14_3_um_filter_66_18]|nr:DegT/DnrJ/EryC1/StrS family aminotransferase [Armatimonadota bacterium]OIP10398.1 MAG: hypothetical protein AUJ96_03915 [Armatimonadetes bacterium CG2_30_66_41]PIU91500.1 MAG: aminotransferase DegT [Armatimonadetes bacterium CG06_land_8_20_14_3_00_66_21]PIX36990.1 MAG: aminotransferase DegT [Armatimonadetes bacterium CG_4_8_14_3_um_filter_66_20]PIY51212.1 MAG: aminotransferase DegT [Armatimonadetes bacterium CG_4_10_14_3_um_filter_66_18]PIZ32441.1 MAG: aminotransferase DegT [Armatimonadetes